MNVKRRYTDGAMRAARQLMADDGDARLIEALEQLLGEEDTTSLQYLYARNHAAAVLDAARGT